MASPVKLLIFAALVATALACGGEPPTTLPPTTCETEATTECITDVTEPVTNATVKPEPETTEPYCDETSTVPEESTEPYCDSTLTEKPEEPITTTTQVPTTTTTEPTTTTTEPTTTTTEPTTTTTEPTTTTTEPTTTTTEPTTTTTEPTTTTTEPTTTTTEPTTTTTEPTTTTTEPTTTTTEPTTTTTEPTTTTTEPTTTTTEPTTTTTEPTTTTTEPTTTTTEPTTTIIPEKNCPKLNESSNPIFLTQNVTNGFETNITLVEINADQYIMHCEPLAATQDHVVYSFVTSNDGTHDTISQYTYEHATFGNCAVVKCDKKVGQWYFGKHLYIHRLRCVGFHSNKINESEVIKSAQNFRLSEDF